ncbi:hypothetical protein Tco_0001191, partial [Tanacetum coccineum]
FDAHIEAWLATSTPPSPSPSLLSPLSSPHLRIPLSPTYRDSILEADLPLQKRARFSPSPFNIGESSAAATARQPGSTFAHVTIDRLVVTVEETNERVTDIVTCYRQDSHEMISILQQQRQDDGGIVTRIIGRVRELERARALKRQDGPPDTGSSC